MKTITKDGVSHVVLDDSAAVFVTESGVNIGDPLEYIIGYLNSNNCKVHEAVDCPDDWQPAKYMFDGNVWSLNQDWVDPLEGKRKEVRVLRDALLTASDWTQVADAPVDQAAWAIYRQALRDVPSQAGFPDNVTWPVKP